MKIALSGYGKMGQEIEKAVLEKNHVIVAKIDSAEDWKNLEQDIKKSDVIIDFSQPDVVVTNIQKCFDLNIPAVVGTTGWENKKEQIRELCLLKNQAIFTASNFSIGVNILFEINKLLANLISKYPYDLTIEETHHIHKKDRPSGTAIELANQIIKLTENKHQWIIDKETDPSDLLINSFRKGEVPGTHIVKYESDIDELEIKHTAKNRKGFAKGAVSAAEWLMGKTGFFEMKDMLGTKVIK
ncbi:MAG: 4-hydroxy-tetrahydrodipicolinate reductase [Bacteroidales bacterium]|nr:4-hydroxy-tetrahydrodipicolinate reductase [Bacteroidales bacterium]